VLQISVSSRHHAHVYAVGPSTSQTFELLFLQNPQQLGLQRQWNIADLVQKKRPLVGQFEAPDFLRDRPGEFVGE